MSESNDTLNAGSERLSMLQIVKSIFFSASTRWLILLICLSVLAFVYERYVFQSKTFYAFSLTVFLAFSFASQNIRLYFLVSDLPTSKLRSASQGFVEIQGRLGKISGQPALFTPYTKNLAIWRYSFKTFTETVGSSRHQRSRTRVVEKSRDMHLCTIDDGTGLAYFFPNKTKMKNVRSHVVRRGCYTYHEYWLEEGDPVYLVGTLRTMEGDKFAQYVYPRNLEKGFFQRILGWIRPGIKQSISVSYQENYLRSKPDQKFNFIGPSAYGKPHFLSTKSEKELLTEYRFWGCAFAIIGFGFSGLTLSGSLLS